MFTMTFKIYTTNLKSILFKISEPEYEDKVDLIRASLDLSQEQSQMCIEREEFMKFVKNHCTSLTKSSDPKKNEEANHILQSLLNGTLEYVPSAEHDTSFDRLKLDSDLELLLTYTVTKQGTISFPVTDIPFPFYNVQGVLNLSADSRLSMFTYMAVDPTFFDSEKRKKNSVSGFNRSCQEIGDLLGTYNVIEKSIFDGRLAIDSKGIPQMIVRGMPSAHEIQLIYGDQGTHTKSYHTVQDVYDALVLQHNTISAFISKCCRKKPNATSAVTLSFEPLTVNLFDGDD
jgi:hypothetical protein